MHEGRDEERGVGDPAGDDDLRAGVESPDDRSRPEVGVGEQSARSPWQSELFRSGPEVVADDDGDLEAGAAPTRRTGCRDGGATGRDGIDAAGVGDELGPPVEYVRKSHPEIHREVAGVAKGLVALPILLQDGQGEFGQRFAHQVVDTRGQDVGHRCFAIAVETLAASERDCHSEDDSGRARYGGCAHRLVPGGGGQ